MKFWLLFITLFTACFLSVAQISESFDDGDFSNNPAWAGDASSFIVNTQKQLQLNENASDIKYLSTPDSLLLNSEWQIWVKLKFDPSNNNNIRIYLTSNKQDLTDSLFGYYLKIGENGSNDGIDLYRQDGYKNTLLIDGTAALVASKPEINIKIID